MPFWLLLGAGLALLLMVGVAVRLATRPAAPSGARGKASRPPADSRGALTADGEKVGARDSPSPTRLASAIAVSGKRAGSLSGKEDSAVPGSGSPSAAGLMVVERAAAAGSVRVTERSLLPRRAAAPPKPAPKPEVKKVPPPANLRLAGARQEIGRLAGPPIPPAEPPLPPAEAHTPLPEPAAGLDIPPAIEEPRVEPEAAEEVRDEPELIERSPVRYPPSAAEEGVSGTVHLKIIVSSRGWVETALVVRSSGDARLDAAAVRSALGWRYRPGRRAGQAVPSVAYAAVQFSLDEDRSRDE